MGTCRRLAVLLALAVAAQAQDDERAQDLFQRHRWFELRAVAVSDRYAAALTKGALASAFNRVVEAEHELKLAMHLAKGTEQLHAAREKLMVLLLRQGRTREAVAQMRAILKRDAERADVAGMLEMFAPLAEGPGFAVRLPKSIAEVPCEVKAEGVWLTLAAHGQSFTWLLDTGANFTSISESEARMLGVIAHETGGTAQTKSGVIERLRLGAVELRNLPVLIFADTQPPWTQRAAGRRGILGLPVAIAMGMLSWTSESHCKTGPGASGEEPNLAFDDFTLVLRVTSAGNPMDMFLDSGNQTGTQLWTRFKADFPAVLVRDGVAAGISDMPEIGGAKERATVEIPEWKFDVAGFAGVLRPAKFFDKPVGNDYQHGLLGMDVLSQAREVVLDFRAMTLSLR